MSNWRTGSNLLFTGYQISGYFHVAALGDSFTTIANSWDEKLNARVQANIVDNGVAGDLLSSANNAGANVEDRYDAEVRDAYAGWVIIIAGVNDVRSAAVGVSPIANMQATANSILAKCQLYGIRLGIATIAPFGGNGAYSPERESYRTTWNSWLISWAASNGVDLYDIATALKDSGDATLLAAAYDFGDGLHPNDAGSTVISDLIYDADNVDLDKRNTYIPVF